MTFSEQTHKQTSMHPNRNRNRNRGRLAILGLIDFDLVSVEERVFNPKLFVVVTFSGFERNIGGTEFRWEDPDV